MSATATEFSSSKQEEPQIESISISSQRKLRGKHSHTFKGKTSTAKVGVEYPQMFLVATMEQITERQT